MNPVPKLKKPSGLRTTNKIKPKFFGVAFFLSTVCLRPAAWAESVDLVILDAASACPSVSGVFCLKPEDFRFWAGQPNGLPARFLRAFRERGLRRGVFWISADEPRPAQEARFAQLLDALKKHGFEPGEVPVEPVRLETPVRLWGRRLIAVAAACSTLLVLLLRPPSPWAGFFLCLGGGSSAWAILQTDAFRSQLEPVYFVSFIFLFPFFVAFMRSRVFGWEHLATAALTVVLATAALARLDARWPVTMNEHTWRDWMDVHIGLRPRIKEVFGWLCWFLISRRRPETARRWFPLALFGPAATINSFLHAHTPWLYIIQRSLFAFAFAWVSSTVIERLIQKKRPVSADREFSGVR
ncbi:MAG: hypothetical protein HYT79_06440 [Elusimicrobia bacterium]|nr:hypothetical protein [Elusimicrobiota bacterium]